MNISNSIAIDRMVLEDWDCGLIRTQAFGNNVKGGMEITLVCNHIKNMAGIGSKLPSSYYCLQPTIIMLIMLSLIKTLRRKKLNIRCLVGPIRGTNGGYNIIHLLYKTIVMKIIYCIVRRGPALHITCWFFHL